MEQSIITYQSLKEISAERFHEIKFTGNIYLVDKEYAEDKKYGLSDLDIINTAWLKLYDEYFEKTDDTNLRKQLKNKEQTLRLLTDINLIKTVLEVLEVLEETEEYTPNEVLVTAPFEIFKSLKRRVSKIKYDTTKDLKNNVQHLRDVLGGLQTRYEILFKEDLKVDENSELQYYIIKEMMEDVLQRNLPEYINMLQWIAYEKSVKRKVENARKYNSRERTSRGNHKGMG